MTSQAALLRQMPGEASSAYRTHTLLLSATTLGLGLSFFLAEQSLRPEVASSAAEVAEIVETVGRSRQIGLMSVGIVGLLLLFTRGGNTFVLNNALATIVLSLGFLCLASVFWTDAFAFTVRRLGSAILCILAVLGVCRQFRPRDLCTMVLIISFAYLCVGISVELLGHGYRIAGNRYRFGGTVNPNLQGMYCALLSLSAACLSTKLQRGAWICCIIFAVGLAFLLLTGSRTALYAFLAAITAHWLLISSWQTRALALTWTPALLGFLILLGLLIGTHSSPLFSIVFIGRDISTVSTMTNRIPIWHELVRYIGERPLLGYGYQGFWQSERVFEMSAATGWAAQGAHSAYLDTLLNVGILGGVLQLLAITLAIYKTCIRYLRTNDLGYAFLFALFVFASVHSLAESVFAKPSLFPGLIFLCGISMVAFQDIRATTRCSDYPEVL